MNDDGTVDEIVGDVPKDWVGAGAYSWQDADNDYTYNYYKRPYWKSRRQIKKVKSYDPETGEEEFNFYPETYHCDCKY